MATTPGSDPWVISSEDRAKYEAQFHQLNPVNGLITGEKVKPILMKSGLSTAVLGHIWGLADINGDGKLDKKEFTIAIHLIRKKLQGSELPKTLPASLKAGTPTSATGASPVAPSSTIAPSAKVVTSPLTAPPAVVAPAKVPVPLAPVPAPVPVASAPVQVPAASIPAPAPVVKAPTPAAGAAPVISKTVPVTSGAKPTSTVSSPPSAAAMTGANAAGSNTATKLQTVTSPSASQAGDGWAIPAAELSRYQQLFNTKDVKKRGYLTGLEAKAILSQSGLPVKVLAQIWNLADIDDDGRLVLEEFQVAMHFVGVAKAGKPVHSSLPREFVPPSYRKGTVSEDIASKSMAPGSMPLKGATPVPTIQPPAGGTRKTIEKSPGGVGPGGRNVPVVPTQPAALPSVPAPAPKPSVDLLLLDDPFGDLPVELPAPLLMQGKSAEAGKKKAEDATPPDVLSSCSVVWNMGAMATDSAAPEGQTEKEVSEDQMDSQVLEIEREASPAPLPDVTTVAKLEEGPDGSVECLVAEVAEPEKPTSVPELHVTTVEDAPASDDENAESVQKEEAEKLDQEKQRKEREEAELIEKQRQEMEQEEERKLQERERQLKVERDMQELERLRQVELENQRQLELEKQKQLELERKKRLEQERQRQAEFEKLKQVELERQKQVEKDKEEQRRKAQEQKEAMQRELQKQRQLDWEHQRRDQLIVLKARCQNVQDQVEKDIARLKKDCVTGNGKKTDIKNKIEKARTVVSEYTSAIETMRLIRDKKLADINSVQLKIEESKRKLAVNQQERHIIDSQLLSCDQHLNDTYKVVLKSCKKKEATVDNLVDQLSKIDQDTAKKMEMIEGNNTKLTELKNRMNALHTEVKTMQHLLINKKQQWDTRNQFGQATTEETKKRKQIEVPENENELMALGYRSYTAVYQFDARSHDELSLQPGVVVWVKPDQSGQESGWMIGRLNGVDGCFPEAYVQPTDAGTSSAVSEVATEVKPEDGESTVNNRENIDDVNDVESVVTSTLTTSVQSSFVSVPSTSMINAEVVGDRGLKAQAIYTWMAKKDNHLTFNKGDVIIIKEQQEMWWSGELNGKVGWFPKSYVKLLDESDGNPAEAEDATVASSVVTSVAEIPSTEVTSSPATSGEQQSEAGEPFTATYPYNSDEPGDLTFSQGDTIMVVKSDGEWWTGYIDGRSGIFPANFVKKVEMPQPVTTQKDTAEASQKLSTVKKPEIATVVAAYEATGSEQLSLQPGQLIQVRKKTDTGWWEGELQVRGQKRRIGWFPANYVKLLGQGGGSRSSVDNTGSCSGSPTLKGTLEMKPAGSRVASGEGVAEPGAEKMVALYDYQSQCDDELTFIKGDIINIVSKEHCEWWKGELAGRIGIFPANFVGPLSENPSE